MDGRPGQLDETCNREIDAGDRVEQTVATGLSRPAIMPLELRDGCFRHCESVGFVLEAPDSDTCHENTLDGPNTTAIVAAVESHRKDLLMDTSKKALQSFLPNLICMVRRRRLERRDRRLSFLYCLNISGPPPLGLISNTIQ